MWRYADGKPVPFVMSYTYTFIVFAVPIAVFFLVKWPWFIALAAAVGAHLALSVPRIAYMYKQNAEIDSLISARNSKNELGTVAVAPDAAKTATGARPAAAPADPMVTVPMQAGYTSEGIEVIPPAGLLRAGTEGVAAGISKILLEDKSTESVGKPREAKGETIGGGKTIGEGLNFDNATYEKAKPHFYKAAYHFRAAADDIANMAANFVQAFRADGAPDSFIQKLRPYVIRFVQDVQAGVIDLKAKIAEVAAEFEGRANAEAETDTQGPHPFPIHPKSCAEMRFRAHMSAMKAMHRLSQKMPGYKPPKLKGVLIESQNRRATPDEQKVWGGLTKAFSDREDWKDRKAVLRELLSGEEMRQAARSISMVSNFDPDTYEKAKPLFIMAVQHFNEPWANVNELLRCLIKTLQTAYRFPNNVNMGPYLLQFARDVRDGLIDLKATAAETDQER
jgi:hypothetical protein